MTASLVTVGHGTLAQGDFAALLRAAGIARLVDVRRYPGSRRNPQFARATMEQWLPGAGMTYEWVEELGGRRSVPQRSPDVALRNAAFRGYAAHMRSAAFAGALAAVLAHAQREQVAVMCAESLWWRCHRRMIADAAALLHGAEVAHLMHAGTQAPHRPTDGVRRDGDVLVYDAVGEPRLDLAD